MDGLTHEEAVGVLKATPTTVELRIEKGALNKDSESPERNDVDVCYLDHNMLHALCVVVCGIHNIHC